MRYTGSGPLALATALRKDRTKALLRAHGVPTPAAAVSVDGTLPGDAAAAAAASSSRRAKTPRPASGCDRWCTTQRELAARVAEVHARYRQPVLIEQFIAGRELYVSLLGNDDRRSTALPMHEVDFSAMPAGAPHIVTYDGKWDPVVAGVQRHALDPRRGHGRRRATRCAAAARAAFVALELSRLRARRSAPRRRRHALRHRRQPQLRSLRRRRRLPRGLVRRARLSRSDRARRRRGDGAP